MFLSSIGSNALLKFSWHKLDAKNFKFLLVLNARGNCLELLFHGDPIVQEVGPNFIAEVSKFGH